MAGRSNEAPTPPLGPENRYPKSGLYIALTVLAVVAVVAALMAGSRVL